MFSAVSPQGPAAVLCSSPALPFQFNSVPFFADLCASWGSGSSRQAPEKRGKESRGVGSAAMALLWEAREKSLG